MKPSIKITDSRMAALLGEDGRGYELARKLESLGVWRSWLGDSLYPTFVRFLSSPTTWEAFMRADESVSKAQLQLQLRARALLFEKASIALYLPPEQASSSSSASLVSKLNPNYLQLHADDLYFTLENSSQDDDADTNATNAMSSKVQPKSNFGVGSRYSESETDFASQQFKVEDLPVSWYDQFFEKYKASDSYKLSLANRETEKRTPEMMAAYLRVLENHKRRRVAFRGDQNFGFGMLDDGPSKQSNLVLDGSSALDQDAPFFPEIMFPMNCVPDNAIPQSSEVEDTQIVEYKGVLDTLPQITAKSPSPIMIERLGIRPEYLSMEQGGNQSRGKSGVEGSRKVLGAEQASKLSQKVVARLLANIGFESSSEVPLEVLAQLMTCHIGKLGRTLKLLTDSYKKQYSATELLKMFLQTSGHSNLGALAEIVKDNSRNNTHPSPHQVQGFQPQLQPQHQAPIRQPQQILRQMHPQMQQMINPINPQNLTLQQQQQWERIRRRQQSTPRPGMGANMNVNIDKDRPLVDVKLENPSDFPMDSTSNAAINNAMNVRNAQFIQMQLRQQQQQLAAMQQSTHPQSGNQFRPMPNPQIPPQVHSPNMGMVRAPPVKVEGFQELMGGDPSHTSEENKLTSPK